MSKSKSESEKANSVDKYYDTNKITENYMCLAAAIVASGYHDNDKEFISGRYSWWHDYLKETVAEYEKDYNIKDKYSVHLDKKKETVL